MVQWYFHAIKDAGTTTRCWSKVDRQLSRLFARSRDARCLHEPSADSARKIAPTSFPLARFGAVRVVVGHVLRWIDGLGLVVWCGRRLVVGVSDALFPVSVW